MGNKCAASRFLLFSGFVVPTRTNGANSWSSVSSDLSGRSLQRMGNDFKALLSMLGTCSSTRAQPVPWINWLGPLRASRALRAFNVGRRPQLTNFDRCAWQFSRWLDGVQPGDADLALSAFSLPPAVSDAQQLRGFTFTLAASGRVVCFNAAVHTHFDLCS